MATSILKGQSIIGGKSFKKGLDRIKHYALNAESNKAFSKSLGVHAADIAREFSNYRLSWSRQPQQWAEALLKGQNYKSVPLSLDLELAAICDLACPYCYRQTFVTPDKVMDEQLAFSLIDQAAELGIPSIKFNWRGEPLLHPKLPHIIQYAKSKGILDTIINTNATQLTPKNIDLLLNSGIDYIIFSFDGGTKSTYEKNRLSRFEPNNFEDVVGNIRNFCNEQSKRGQAFPWTRVQMVLTPDAINEQVQYKELFDEYVDEVCVNNYDERGLGTEIMNPVDKEKFNHKVQKYHLPNDSHYIKIDTGEILVSKSRKACDQPFQRLLVTYDGRVSMCCFDWGSRHTIGFVSDKSFDDINSDKYRVHELIKKSAKGFELMKNAVMPPQLYSCPKVVKSLAKIWHDTHISQIRSEHAKSNCQADICKTCTYRGTHEWV